MLISFNKKLFEYPLGLTYLLPKLIARLNEGFDVVSGWRYSRKDSISKKLFSKLSRFLRSKIINDKIHDSGCSLKIYKKEALENLSTKYGEVIKTIPDFNEKLQDELKSISEGLDPKVRVEKAFKLVINSNTSTADAFSIMQGISWVTKADKKDDEKDKTNDSPLDKAFKSALLG